MAKRRYKSRVTKSYLNSPERDATFKNAVRSDKFAFLRVVKATACDRPVKKMLVYHKTGTGVETRLAADAYYNLGLAWFAHNEILHKGFKELNA